MIASAAAITAATLAAAQQPAGEEIGLLSEFGSLPTPHDAERTFQTARQRIPDSGGDVVVIPSKRNRRVEARTGTATP